MNLGIILFVLLLFAGMAAALIARRQHQREGKPVPFLLTLAATSGFVFAGALCAFGFLASFEASEQAMSFRVIYACIGLLAAGAAVRLGRPSLHR